MGLGLMDRSHRDQSKGMSLNDPLAFLHPHECSLLIGGQEAISTQTHEIEYLEEISNLIRLKIMSSVNQGTILCI